MAARLHRQLRPVLDDRLPGVACGGWLRRWTSRAGGTACRSRGCTCSAGSLTRAGRTRSTGGQHERRPQPRGHERRAGAEVGAADGGGDRRAADGYRPFSNGTEHMMWLESNCGRGEKGCRKYKPMAPSSKTGCPIEVAVALGGCDTGLIPIRIAVRGGFLEPGRTARSWSRRASAHPARRSSRSARSTRATTSRTTGPVEARAAQGAVGPARPAEHA
jgi:hypothetical protein